MSATPRGVRRFVGAIIVTAIVLPRSPRRPALVHAQVEFSRITADSGGGPAPRRARITPSVAAEALIGGDVRLRTQMEPIAARAPPYWPSVAAWPRQRAGAMQRDLVVRAREGDHDAFSELARARSSVSSGSPG